MHSFQKLIFLTGCINPDGMSFTELQDPVVRRQQYIEAIEYYLLHTSLPLLFVENTLTDISGEFEKAIRSGRLEILTFNGNDYDKRLGKGYGEMVIIEHAVRNSVFLKQSAFVYKITGRYKLLNLQSFLKEYDVESSKRFMGKVKRKEAFADSRFWGADFHFLSAILIRFKGIINDSDGVFFEHALFKAIEVAKGEDYVFRAIKYLPRFSGIYGTDNVAYNDTWLHWFPRNVKHYFLRKFFNK